MIFRYLGMQSKLVQDVKEPIRNVKNAFELSPVVFSHYSPVKMTCLQVGHYPRLLQSSRSDVP